MINLYNIDCMEYLAICKDNEFDLAIVDPPYGIGINVNMGRRKGDKPSQYKKFAGEDKEPMSEEYFQELERVSKNQIIWGANHFRARNSSCWIVWDKLNSGNFADAELAYTSFNTVVRVFRYMWNGMLQSDMKNKEQRIHPTQKPVKLYEWILMNYAKKGDRILDTHLGSGSIAIACHNLGFDLVGCELDVDYFKAAEKRLLLHQMQLRIPME
jgi:site-specific DNA-methyltransferase (adenine-specific)